MSLSDSISINSQLTRWQRWSPILIPFLAAALVLIATRYIVSVQLENVRQEQRIRITTLAGSVRAQLESELNSSVHLCMGLVTYVSANPDFNEDGFVRIAKSMMNYGRHVRVIAVAPDNVIRHIYPTQGNEKALGLRYMDNPEQREAIQRMMQTRDFVLAGPVDLVQGGRGFINRLPIFTSSQQGNRKLEAYWGLASVVLDVDSLLKAGGITQPPPGIRLALRGHDGLGAKGGMIYGDPAIFERNPILLDVLMLGDSRWQLAVIPDRGWEVAPENDVIDWLPRVGAILALLVASLIYVWLREIRNIHRRDAALRLAANVFESANEGMLVTDHERKVIAVNPAVGKITGYSPAELLDQSSELLAADDDMSEIFAQVTRNSTWQGEVWARRKDGRVYPQALTINAVYDADHKAMNYVSIFSDISERKSIEQRIHHLAHHDALTGLPNRMDLHDRLKQAIAVAARHNSLLAAMILDMDNFKIINDTLGHHIGDGILVEVANRLVASVRNSDIVARLGGDEFVIVLSEVDSPVSVAAVAEKLLTRLSQAYMIEGYELHSTPSIGIGLYPQDGDSVESLLKNVDTAMYHAKSAGRNNYQFFTEDMRQAVGDRLRMENSLRQAISNKEFMLHYQPQIDIATGRVSAVEALLRWSHPELGLVPPTKFIAVAEESDLIIPIGEWILKEACMQSKKWRDQGIEGIRMSVNISARQLQSKNLFPLIDKLIKKHALEPGQLELEITESVAMENPEKTIELLNKLRNRGLHLAIDDFGTGYSSLSYLKLLPLNRLKIDRSFVKDIEIDPNDAAICSATIALAHILDLSLVAEGVETEAQLEYLRGQGCETAQGYLFSKPLPADEFALFLAKRQA